MRLMFTQNVIVTKPYAVYFKVYCWCEAVVRDYGINTTVLCTISRGTEMRENLTLR